MMNFYKRSYRRIDFKLSLKLLVLKLILMTCLLSDFTVISSYFLKA